MFWRSRESAFVVFRQRPESRNRPSLKIKEGGGPSTAFIFARLRPDMPAKQSYSVSGPNLTPGNFPGVFGAAGAVPPCFR